MWSVSIKSLLANKFRLALTSLAIVFGVGFVVASFVLSDSLQSSFGTLSRELVGGTDLVVRPLDEFGTETSVDDGLLTQVREVDGVRAAHGTLDDDMIQPIKPDGTTVTLNGPPQIGTYWTPDVDLNRLKLVEGTEPSPGGFVMDTASAERHGFVLDETYGIVSPQGRFDLTLVGLARMGESNVLNGALITAYSESDARRVLGFEPGVWEDIEISVDDTRTGTEVGAALTSVLGSDYEVVNQQTLEDEISSDFNQGISILRNILLAFATVSLFVSTFIIYNTFGIILAQRVREIGLLRAIGAEVRQVRRSVLAESAIIGLVASVMGILFGLVLQFGLLELFERLGVPLPVEDTIIGVRTIAVALIVGVGVTVASAIAPARRASRVTPIAAMTGQVTAVDKDNGRRIIVGVSLFAIGVLAGFFGLFVTGSTRWTIAGLAVGMLGVFCGVAMLAPFVAKPVTRVLGWPIGRLFGVAGEQATLNAGRNPRRTATTAGALMIGLALVTTALVVGDSMKAQISTTLDRAVQADHVIANDTFDPFPVSVVDDVRALPEIGTNIAVTWIDVEVNDSIMEIDVTDLNTVDQLFTLSIEEGTVIDNDDSINRFVLPVNMAADLGLAVGDSVEMTLETGQSDTFVLTGTYSDVTLFESGIVNLAAIEKLEPLTSMNWMGTQVADGFSMVEAEAALATIQERHPQLNATTKAGYQEEIEGQIDQMLQIINAMLGLAILIALLGIGLTLALSVFERTRELGLMRAVGMTRRQLRRMVRWEAALVALFGAVLGVAIGLLFGWASVRALPDDFTTTVAVPELRILILMGVAGLAGLVAALLPARRAGKLNVLDAIAQ